MAKVIKLPKIYRINRAKAEAAREALREIEMSVEARAEIENTLYKITDTPGCRSVFTMISNDQFRHVMKATRSMPRPDLTWKVFSLAVTYTRQDTGEIMATRDLLAEEAATDVGEVSRAMGELSKIGAILKHKRGRNVVYSVNPHVAWNGGEGARLAAARTAPKLKVVGGKDTDQVAGYLIERATEFLQSCDWGTRDRWAKRAIELGAEKLPAMTAKDNIGAWSRWVALELVADGQVNPEP